MIPVGDALTALFDLVAPLDTEPVALADAAGRHLAEDGITTRAQPPFASSAMDGYAVRTDDARPGATLRVIGTAAAGHGNARPVGPGEAMRIFTGAPVPEGADRIVIQEDVRAEAEKIHLSDTLDAGPHIRPAGGDFAIGARLTAPRRLSPTDIALAAAMNLPTLTCRRRPVVAMIATGDELVMPGEAPRPDQIVASNGFGLKAMIDAAGGHARLLPIARDSRAALAQAFDFANGADLIVTIGGASVGDADLVRETVETRGSAPSFYKVAMRPGKPLMAGRIDRTPFIGVPGNPVSSMVCGAVFILPMLRAMLGLGAAPAPRLTAPLAAPLRANGPREHYMRARLGPDGLTAFGRQDSSLLTVLASANALIVRPVNDPERPAGDMIEYVPLADVS